MSNFAKTVKNSRGQGLIEYLIVVALMAVGSILVVRTLSQVVQSRFASVAAGLQGEKHTSKVKIDSSNYHKRDMGNFFEGVSDKKKNSNSDEDPGSHDDPQ